MTATYWKATRPDGTDFRTGTVDYAAALASGVPLPKLRGQVLCESGLYHVSIEPGEVLVGGSWPCRLFKVEGLYGAFSFDVYDDFHKYKRGFQSLRVVEEVEAHQALGPNGAEVAALIERIRACTQTQVHDLAEAWDEARGDAARDAAWYATRGAARGATWGATWGAAWFAVLAVISRDLITEDQFNTLYAPWASVMDVTS